MNVPTCQVGHSGCSSSSSISLSLPTAIRSIVISIGAHGSSISRWWNGVYTTARLVMSRIKFLIILLCSPVKGSRMALVWPATTLPFPMVTRLWFVQKATFLMTPWNRPSRCLRPHWSNLQRFALLIRSNLAKVLEPFNNTQTNDLRHPFRPHQHQNKLISAG